MSKLSPAMRAVCMAGTVCVFAGIVYAGLYWWLGIQYRELADLRTKVGASSQTHDLIRAQQSLAEQTADERNELNGYLLSMSDPGAFLELIEQLGTETNAELEVTAVMEEAKPPAKSGTAQMERDYVLVSVEAGGSWQALHRLLRLFELMPYAVTVDQVAIARSEAAPQTLWDMQCTLRVAARAQ